MMKAGLALALGLALSTSANAQRNNASSAPPPPPAAIPPPPPPPPLPDSPAVADAMAKAQACFFGANWDRSVQLASLFRGSWPHHCAGNFAVGVERDGNDDRALCK